MIILTRMKPQELSFRCTFFDSSYAVHQLPRIDVLFARLRIRVFPATPKSFPRILQPSFLLSPNPQKAPFPAAPEHIRTSLRGASLPKRHSISIGRARRNRQRLPSSLLIENVPAISTTASSRHSYAATFPIKANDFSAKWIVGTKRVYGTDQWKSPWRLIAENDRRS